MRAPMRILLAIAVLVGLGCSPQTTSIQRTATPRAAARWVKDNLSAEPFVRSWEAQLGALAAKSSKRAA